MHVECIFTLIGIWYSQIFINEWVVV